MIINENGFVYKTIDLEKYTIKALIGNQKMVTKTETATETTYKWRIFDVELGQYVDDTTNGTPIEINGVEYTSVDGKAVISKLKLEEE